MKILATLTAAAAMAAVNASAQKVSTAQLIEMAKNHAAGLEQALRDTLTDANIHRGAAAAGELGEFVYAVTADKPYWRDTEAWPSIMAHIRYAIRSRLAGHQGQGRTPSPFIAERKS
jgi:hypothetical protein